MNIIIIKPDNKYRTAILPRKPERNISGVVLCVLVLVSQNYTILCRYHCTLIIDIPQTPNLFPTFHMSQVKPFNPNNNNKFPRRMLDKPGPIQVDRVGEHLVDKIIHRLQGSR